MADSGDRQSQIPQLFFEPADADDASLRAMQTIMPGQFLHPGGTQIVPPTAGVGSSPLPVDNTAAFRPQLRPPIAMLCILHDGDAGGESDRAAADRYVIARNEGDIRIPHDPQISGRQHAEIVRTRAENGQFRWHLADLGSTNGTFVRVSKVALLPRVELMFGQTRYRFESGQTQPKPAPPTILDGQMTVRPGTPQPRVGGENRRPCPRGDHADRATDRELPWFGTSTGWVAIQASAP